MTNILIAIGIGIVGGFIGFIPFLVARSRMRASMKKGGGSSIIAGLVAMLVSFVILAIQILICRLLAVDYFVPFSITVIVIFLVAMGIYVAMLMRR